MSPELLGSHRARLARALEHIERNLGSDLRLASLARHCGVSAYYFQRLFRAAVGESPKQYVRRLRLERAAVWLKHTQAPVVELALAAGFRTHEAFTRAFTARFRVPPRLFRKDALARLEPPRVAPRLASLPTRLVAFARHVGPYDRLEPAFAALDAWADAHALRAGDRLGVFWDDQEITAPERTRCHAAMVLRAPAEGEGAVGVRRLRGGPCAVFAHDGPPEERRRIYAWIYGAWLPALGRRPGGEPPFEIYSANGPTQVHIPLER